jgi:hypothetical protein
MPILGIVASQISGHLDTFTPTGSYDALATYTVGAGGISSITFAGLPTGGQYSHLQIRSIAQCSTNTSLWQRIVVAFNGDTTNSNYADHILQDSGSTTGSVAETSTRKGFGAASNTGVSYFFANITDILDYASSSKYKVSRTLRGMDRNTTGNGSSNIAFESSLWMSTSPISSITLTLEDGSNFNQYSQFAVYGVK